MALRLRPAPLRAALILLAICAASVPARALDVNGVSFTRAADGPELVVRVRADAPIRLYSVDQSSGGVDVLIHDARLAADLRRDRAQGPIRRYRLGMRGDRVAIHFETTSAVEVQAYPDRDSNDLLLAITPSTRQRVVAWGGVAASGRSATETPPLPATAGSVSAGATASAAVRATGGRAPRPRPESQATPDAPPRIVPVLPHPAVRVATPEAPPVAAGTPPAGEPIVPAVTPTGAAHWRLDTIVLDAGHGAHDVGATYNGVREKDVTLGITRRLGRMIEQELGIHVIYTRTGDRFEELRDRGRIANRAGGKLFISVHANAAGSSSASGTETYFLAPHRSDSAREVMDRENSVVEMESDPSLYAEYTGTQGDVLQAMAMSAFQQESQELAGLIESEFRDSGRRSRGVKQAGFLVLWAASMPAVLVETGFVSNPDEARLLSSETGQEATARAIFQAVRAYRDRTEQALRLAAGS